ncbi:E3 ubiquitin-protein ligase TRIM39-like [Acipenser ruthenus]|uniref:E3 ubiquitin-protein ligase TRIM39-like n=1 Tax=Acipenser ruthenus TaxID=7906 RepID=UPI002740359A|nr:E3 ubiquitin-protein ligase TRIM39-like [Acipenser ruthenus]
MATAASPEEKFSCSVCLDLFTEPATIPCGHSFCLDCIGSYWDLSDQTGVYSCPQCRETFTPRPVLRKSNVLNELVEELKKTRRLDSKSNIASLCICFCPSCSVQKELGERQAEIENLIEERLKELERLNQAVESLKLSAHKERAESEQVLSELIRSMERIRTEVGELIGAKEKAAVSRADEQREQLEQEIQELRKRKAEMEQLSKTEEHIHFLQSFQSVCAPPAAQQLFDNIDDSFWTLRKAVSRLKDHVEGFWKVELMKAAIAALFSMFLTAQILCLYLWSRMFVSDMFSVLYCICFTPTLFSTVDVTLDPDTAHPRLILSKDGKQVKDGNKRQPLPDNPKRFDTHICVLGREGFTSGRHYWEVEVGKKIHWGLGVTRESSQRKGGITENPQKGFWTVRWDCVGSQFYAATEPVTPLPLSLKPRKLGVYLDYEGGQLSFYNEETRSHIYTFTDTFTEKLYPLFSPGLYSFGKNAAPLIICPHTCTD